MTRLECPICEDRDYKVLDNGTPYVQCRKCDFWYQRELPTKLYEASHEQPGDAMSSNDKAVNANVALQLYDLFLRSKRLSFALDIGAKFPWLMHSLNIISEGKVETWAIDGIPDLEYFVLRHELKVNGHTCDFETADKYPWGNKLKFDLITMIHVIEHFYDPVPTLSKVHNLLTSDGKVFIRCPAHDVSGIERDFTESHYTIHPQIWGKRSLEYMAESLGFKILMKNELQPGQRDLVLVKQ